MTTALKRTLRTLVVFVSIGLVIGGCGNDDDVEKSYIIGDISLSEVGGKGYANSHISTKGSNSRKETGFIFGTSEGVSIDNYTNKFPVIDSLSFNGTDFFSGYYYGLNLSSNYYVKAYLVDEKDKTFYSNPYSFTTGCIAVDSITPRTGGANTNITVYGKNFGSDIDKLDVRFRHEAINEYGNITFLSNSIINVDFKGSSFKVGDKVEVIVETTNCSGNHKSIEKGDFQYK
ncbi:MAG TPA: IPT/TIG domain-containing protein [Cytophagaceae bacterium]